MTTIAVCSAKGSPGVSTLACLLGAVWPQPRRVVVAECDPSGNDIAARFGLSPLVGMTSLILSTRRDQGAPFESQVQVLPGGLEVLVGPVSPDGAHRLDRELHDAGVAISFSVPADLIVDCGRLDPFAIGQRAVIGVADHVVLLVRPDGAGIAHARAAVASLGELRGGARQSWFVEVGPSPFDDCDIARVIGVSKAGSLPLDHVAAAMVCGCPGPPRMLARSGLVHATRRIADVLVQRSVDDQDALERSGRPESRTDGERAGRRDRSGRRSVVSAPVHAGDDADTTADV
jgi:hypothetical protein